MNFLRWLFSLFSSPTPPPQPVPTDIAGELAKEHNRQRSGRGLPLLILDDRLNAAAQKHAEEMAARQVLDHAGANGSSAGQRMKREGWSGNTWGENIAFGQSSVEQVMTSWMNSSGHRSNILSSKFKVFGIGIAKDKNERIYWCVTFGG